MKFDNRTFLIILTLQGFVWVDLMDCGSQVIKVYDSTTNCTSL
jgi:hypothetical protein